MQRGEKETTFDPSSAFTQPPPADGPAFPPATSRPAVAVGNAPLSSKHPTQLPTTDCLLSIIPLMGGQPSDAPALSPPSPLQQGGQSSNAPALSPPSPLPQGGQPIALAISPSSPPPQDDQPSDAPGLSPSSSTLLLCPSDSTLSICRLNSQSAVKTELVVVAGILPVMTWGVIANVINMAVFARQGLSDRIHMCLFSLAVSDTGFLLSLMCRKSYILINLVDPVAGNYWLNHSTMVAGCYMGFLSVSNFITALIAAERCLCILSPLKAARLFKTKTIIDILYKQTLSVTLPFISLLVVIVCTIAIVQRLKVTANWRRRTVSNMTSVEKQEVMVTRMLVTVCCVYVVCMIPNVSWSLMLLARLPGFQITGHLCNAFRMTTVLAHVMEVFNASVNFFIYTKQSSHYRSTLRQLCHCVREQQKKKGDS
ncbi:hypothetical protein ACOMHN_050118 [Nucella lapillus]